MLEGEREGLNPKSNSDTATYNLQICFRKVSAKYLAFLCAKLQRLIRSRCRKEQREVAFHSPSHQRQNSVFKSLTSEESKRLLKNRSREGNKIHCLLRSYLAAQPNRHSFWKRGPKLPRSAAAAPQPRRPPRLAELYQMTAGVRLTRGAALILVGGTG